MNDFDLIIQCVFAFAWLGGVPMAIWNLYKRKRVIRSALFFPCILLATIYILVVPPAFSHFHIADQLNIIKRIPEIYRIVVADDCELMKLENDFAIGSRAGQSKYVAFAGNYRGPAMSGMIDIPYSPDIPGENGAVVNLNFSADFDPSRLAASAEFFADGEKINARLPKGYVGFYSESDALLIMEKIAAAEQARVVVKTETGESAETELSAGDICRFRKLRDLWRGEL